MPHLPTSPAPTSPASSAPVTSRRPAWRLLGQEPWRAAVEYAWHQACRWWPRRACGDGHAVILLPGLAADERAMAPLRGHCQALGWRAVGWGRGRNRGPGADLDAWLDRLADDLDGLARRTAGERPFSLVGWSLGGLYAREVAKRLPGRVRQVVTLGTPVHLQVDSTHVGWLYRLLNRRRAQLDGRRLQALAQPPAVPTTAIYSRDDGIVPWQACVTDAPGPLLRQVAVRSSHLGMAWNPLVLRAVTRALAQPESATAPAAGRPLRWRTV